MLDYEALGVLRHFAVYQSSCPSPFAGGLAIFIKSALLVGCEVVGHDLVPGRLLAVDIVKAHHSRFYMSVHLSPSEGATWNSLAIIASDYVEALRELIDFLLGSFNVCVAPQKSFSISTRFSLFVCLVLGISNSSHVTVIFQKF